MDKHNYENLYIYKINKNIYLEGSKNPIKKDTRRSLKNDVAEGACAPYRVPI